MVLKLLEKRAVVFFQNCFSLQLLIEFVSSRALSGDFFDVWCSSSNFAYIDFTFKIGPNIFKARVVEVPQFQNASLDYPFNFFVPGVMKGIFCAGYLSDAHFAFNLIYFIVLFN